MGWFGDLFNKIPVIPGADVIPDAAPGVVQEQTPQSISDEEWLAAHRAKKNFEQVPVVSTIEEAVSLPKQSEEDPDDRWLREYRATQQTKQNAFSFIPDAGIGDSPRHMPDGTVEQPQGRLYTDAAQAVGDWGQGAAQGLAEIGRRQGEASQYSMTDDSGMTYLKPGATMDNAVYADDMANQAKGTFLRETVKPVAMPLALVGGPVGAVAGAATVPFMAEDAVHSYEKGGVGQVARDFTYGGVVDAFAQPDLAERLGQNPARTVADVGMAALPVALMAKGAYKGGASVHDTINRIFDEKLGELGETRPFAAINGLDALDQVDSPTRGFRPATPEEAKQWNLDQQYAPLFDQLPPEPATSKLSLDPIAIKDDIVSAVTADYNRRMGIEQSVSPMKFSDGYRVESNKLLHEAEPHEIVLKPDGSPFFGEISHEVASQIDPSYGVIPGKILMQVGRDSNGQGSGLIHMKKRESSFQKAGFAGAEDFINDTLQNFNEIRENQKGRLLLIKRGSPNQLSSIELQPIDYNGNRYYSVITSMPVREKGASYFTKNKLLYERSPSLSPESDVGSASWNPSQKVGEMDQGGNAKSSFVNNNIQQPKELFNGKEYSLAGKQEFSREELLKRAIDAADNKDFDTALKLARATGDARWENAFRVMRDTEGGELPLPPRERKPKFTNEFNGEAITKQEIIDRASELFSPIRTGRIGEANADGFMDHSVGVMRTRDYGDLSVMSHEIGHWVDAALKTRKNASSFDGELANVVHERFGESAYAPQQIRAEGIAEFFKDYTHSPLEAKKTFPGFYDFFENELSKNKELKAKVDEYQRMIQTWENQSSIAKARSGVSFSRDVKRPIKEKILNTTREFKEDWVNDEIGLVNLGKEYQKATGEKLGFHEDPYKVSRAYNAAKAHAELLVTGDDPVKVMNALNPWYGDAIKNPVTIKSILESMDYKKLSKKYPDFLKKANCKTWDEVLGVLLTARRQEELRARFTTSAIEHARQNVEQKRQNVVEAIKQRMKAEISTGHQNPFEKKLVLDQFRERESVAKSELKEAMRELDYAKDKKYKTPIEEEHAFDTMRDVPKEIQEAADKFHQYADNMLNVLYQAGMITKEAYTEMKKYKNYASMEREFSDEAALERGFGMGSGYGNVRSAIRSISEEGSTRPVINPVESMIKNTYALLDLVRRNNVGKTFSKLADGDRVGHLINRVNGTPNSKDCTFHVWENGEKVTYEAIDKSIYNAIMKTNKESAGFIVDLLSLPAATLRAGSTLALSFSPKNFIRDLYNAAIYTQNGVVPGNYLKAVFHMVKNDQEFYNYRASGAMMSALHDIDRNHMQSNIRDLYMNTASHYWGRYNPLALLRNVSDTFETLNRLPEHQAMLDKGASVQEAALAAKDITTDFSVAGKKGKIWNRYDAFFNAAIQGGNRMIQECQNNPLKFAAKGMLYITVPSVYLWAINHDKDWYKELPSYQRDMFWVMELPNWVDPVYKDNLLRIPKPEGPGWVFGSMPERALDFLATKDQSKMKEFAVNFAKAMTPNLLPNVLDVFAGWMYNYSNFTERNIVPQRELGLEPYMQYGPETSGFAKAVGKQFNLSPRKIDNLAAGLGGTLARETLGLADAIAGNKAFRNPLETAFVIDPNKNPQSVQDFYDKLSDYEAKQRTASTLKTTLSGNEKYNYDVLKKTSEGMAELTKKERGILQDAKLSDEQKRNKVSAVNKLQLQLAQAAIKQLRK